MNIGAYPSSRTDAERTIALARVALACTSLFAVWLDPAEPARYAELTYTLHAIYVVYAVAIAGAVWLRSSGDRLPLVTHVTDIGAFSIFQFLTLGPSSPFFVYFIFSLFCAAIRWGWRATLWSATVIVAAFLGMTYSVARAVTPVEFELNRAIIRTMYLIVCAGLLVYFGRHEQRLRDELERLARWPGTGDADVPRAAERILQHGAGILGARRALLVWEADEEPAVHVASWTPAGGKVTTHPPRSGDTVVPPALAEATFVATGTLGPDTPLLVSGGDADGTGHVGLRLGPLAVSMSDASGLASAPFQTGQISGRVFFGDLGTPGAEIVPLTQLVAREVGNSLEQLHMARQLREIAASEERIRVARDLHDGVLQSLTGIRLEIRGVASSVDRVSNPIRDHLFAIERALAIEQRELRMFIDSLGPNRRPYQGGSLPARLDALRERVALEWKTPVTINIAADVPDLAPHLSEAVPLMVHEGVVNALKHGNPSRVTVTVARDGPELRITIADDGHGFPFRGRYDHGALAGMESAPRSLLDRVAALEGRLAVDSSEAGSRVELQVPL